MKIQSHNTMRRSPETNSLAGDRRALFVPEPKS